MNSTQICGEGRRRNSREIRILRQAKLEGRRTSRSDGEGRGIGVIMEGLRIFRAGLEGRGGREKICFGLKKGVREKMRVMGDGGSGK